MRIIDRSSNPQDSKAGDVIAVCNDGWQWSVAERSNPDWIIVSVKTGLTAVEIQAWIANRTDPLTGELILRRDYKLDTSGISIPANNPDGTRPIITMTAQQVRKLVSKKP